MEEDLEFCVDYALKLNAQYAEARFQSDISESIILKNGVPEATIFTEERGISIRTIINGSIGFASTDRLTRKNLKRTVERCVKLAEASARSLKEKTSMAKSRMGRGKVEIKPKIKSDSIDLETKIDILREADRHAISAAEEEEANLPARIYTLDTQTTEKIIITSDGANVRSVIPRIALSIFITANKPGRGTVQRHFDLGETSGWEAIEGWSLPELLSSESKSLARILKEAAKTPKGVLDVILGPEVIGLVAHESSGHPAEADRILGREAAQAGETYLEKDSIGIRVGSKHVNVIDDPTIKGSFGFYLYDDEGVEARKRYLIKEGIITEFLHNRETASIFRVESNGSSRANAYNREPIVRMANTFLQPGDYTIEELMEDIKDGLYIKNFMEWNIDDRRFNQRYVGLEAYRIINGEIKGMVKNPTLEVTTVGLWSAVDAVGKDLKFQAAYCGKGDPLQGIPVWTGGPHTRLRKIRFGD